jgi:hypothetical protein
MWGAYAPHASPNFSKSAIDSIFAQRFEPLFPFFAAK